jgi:uncharacterized protein (DUF433 family)
MAAWESVRKQLPTCHTFLGEDEMAREIARGITIDPNVMVGKPVIKGTRMPVDLVLAKLSANPDPNDLLADYPHLTVDQIKDCLRYASELVPKAERARNYESSTEPAIRGTA